MIHVWLNDIELDEKLKQEIETLYPKVGAKGRKIYNSTMTITITIKKSKNINKVLKNLILKYITRMKHRNMIQD